MAIISGDTTDHRVRPNNLRLASLEIIEKEWLGRRARKTTEMSQLGEDQVRSTRGRYFGIK